MDTIHPGSVRMIDKIARNESLRFSAIQVKFS